MKYLSVCSGIEAATVAWHHMGWEPVGFAEIEKFPAQVLAHHYPSVPNYQDLTKHEQWPIERGAVDLLVGGTPCQSFSVAGLRGGMADARGQLSFEYVHLAARLRPRWIVWENVPGVLSSGRGRDFGSFLGALGELGYGYAYRTLDAQYFGVAQRRRRVFVVGYLGDWRRAAAVLFERESLCGHPSPRRETRQGSAQKPRASAASSHTSEPEVVGAIDCRINAQRAQNAASGHLVTAKCLTRGEGYRYDFETCNLLPIGTDCYNGATTGDVAATLGTPGSSVNASGPTVMVPQPMTETVGSLTAALGRNAMGAPEVDANLFVPVAHSLRGEGFDASEDGAGRGTPLVPAALAPTITASNDPSRSPQSSEVTHQVAAVHSAAMQVRRLTPVECERLQGFPDGYTDIRLRGKDTPDGPRYKALGNSMAVPVMRWIGERINAVDKM